MKCERHFQQGEGGIRRLRLTWCISVYIDVKIGELLMVNPQSALSSPLEAADALNSPALQ